MSYIKLEQISKTYGSRDNLFYALKSIYLEISQGEMLSIMGPSGSGKTTLLNIIGCMDSYSEGKYFFKEKEIGSFSRKLKAQLRNSSFGFVFQNFSLINEYTSLENVELPLYYRNTFKESTKIPKAKIRDKSLELLDFVGLVNHCSKYPTQLSGGQQQRVAIARALINDAPIIIADEPTGALDQSTGKEIMELFKLINSQGKTIIIVTHDDRVAAFSDRIIHLEDGKICK